MFILVIGFFVSCESKESSSETTPESEKEEVKPETSKKLKEAQDLNVELEEIDGELDSLINALN